MVAKKNTGKGFFGFLNVKTITSYGSLLASHSPKLNSNYIENDHGLNAFQNEMKKKELEKEEDDKHLPSFKK